MGAMPQPAASSVAARPRRAALRRRLGTVTRRLVFVLLGSLLSAPYVAVVIWAVALYRFGAANPLAPLFGTAVAVGLFAVPAALRVTASIERTACDELLDTRLGRDVPAAELGDVFRSALWFGVHLATGLLFAVLLVVLLPGTVVLILAATGTTDDEASRALAGVDAGTGSLIFLGGTVASAVLLAAVVPQMPRWAVFLLGPSAGQRVALAEREARAAAQRNRLARELHDSIGHALTVTTLQAAAARSQLRRDPDAAEAALAAVEETGRNAQRELDSALAILRGSGAGEAGDRDAPAGAPGLERLDDLLGSFGAAGLDVRATVGAPSLVASVPLTVSREGYRLVQEALTNALRHGSAPWAAVHVAADGAWLRVRVSNPADGVGSRSLPAGRGLIGLRERVLVLGGRLEAGFEDGLWTVDGELPIGPEGRQLTRGSRR